MLANDIARCEGKPWPDFGVQPECINCARRLAGEADARVLMDAWVPWTSTPEETPCPIRMEAK